MLCSVRYETAMSTGLQHSVFAEHFFCNNDSYMRTVGNFQKQFVLRVKDQCLLKKH